jgi:alkylation response protein AidB-like acyl-CoA dehydrogenase
VDFELDDRRTALNDRVRDFCSSELKPGLEAELDRTAEFPHELYRKMAEYGLFGIPFPEEYGGIGGDILDVVLAAEQVSRYSNTAVNMFLVPVVFGGMMVYQCGDEAQKADLLPRLVTGEVRFAFALTEPGAGSDPRSITTAADRDGDGFAITGTKYWTTGATVADYILVVALTDRDVDPGMGMTVFLVPRESNGLTVTPIPKLAGGAYPSCEVVLDAVKVSERDVVGGPGCVNGGWMQLLTTADLERICVAASCVGGAQAVLDMSVAFAKEREQFGRPVFKFQAMQHRLADMATRVDAMRWMTVHAAWMKAAGRDCFKEICMAKLFCSESLGDVVRSGMQAMGGRGYAMEYDMQRYLRESYLAFYAGGTAEIQKSVIARFL